MDTYYIIKNHNNDKLDKSSRNNNIGIFVYRVFDTYANTLSFTIDKGYTNYAGAALCIFEGTVYVIMYNMNSKTGTIYQNSQQYTGGSVTINDRVVTVTFNRSGPIIIYY